MQEEHFTPKLKYRVPETEDNGDILPNLLDLQTIDEINRSEFEGFYRAERILIETLSTGTIFDCKYIKAIHKLALGHLYSFAGKYRTVNIMKDDFLFPPAQFLHNNMLDFEENILKKLPKVYESQLDLVRNIATVHSEFLFIHPFREGNGRTARILANMMSYQAGYGRLQFEQIVVNNKFSEYVFAVQNASSKDYRAMEKIIEYIF